MSFQIKHAFKVQHIVCGSNTCTRVSNMELYVGATYSKYVVVTIAYITTVFSLIMYFCFIMCDILK